MANVVIMQDIINGRCGWCGTDRLYVEYHDREWSWRRDGVRWVWLLLAVLAVAALPLSVGYRYCILPPLVVTFV